MSLLQDAPRRRGASCSRNLYLKLGECPSNFGMLEASDDPPESIAFKIKRATADAPKIHIGTSTLVIQTPPSSSLCSWLLNDTEFSPVHKRHLSAGHCVYEMPSGFVPPRRQLRRGDGKINGVLRFSGGDLANGFNVTAMGYKAR